MGDPLQQAPRRLIAGLVGSLAVIAWVATASAAPEDAFEARLEIDTREAGAGAEVLHRRIEERANIVLRHTKVLPGDRDDAAIVIVIRELEGEDPGYEVRFELRDADGATIAEPRVSECRLCTETELVARVEDELEPVVAALREAASSEPEPATETEAALDPDPTPEPVPPAAPTSANKRMLASGVSLLVVGVGALGAGVGLAIPEPKIDEDNPLDLITTRPVGYGVLAGGVVLAVTGAVLTGIAVERRRQARWSMSPYGGRSQAGVVFAWRFR